MKDRLLSDSGASRRLRMLAVASALLVVASGCTRQSEARAEQFVGQWKSSRLATMPLHMHGNGEWEIRGGDGHALQYGVWQLQDGRILWTIRMDGRIAHDENAVLSVRPTMFELRERDGSVTRFDRID